MANSFREQTPAALTAIAAMIAILLVNTGDRASSPPIEADTAASCTNCGEVISIRPLKTSESSTGSHVELGYALDVRMTDGSVRTIRQFVPRVPVGGRVKIEGDSITRRG